MHSIEEFIKRLSFNLLEKKSKNHNELIRALGDYEIMYDKHSRPLSLFERNIGLGEPAIDIQAYLDNLVIIPDVIYI